MSRLPRPNISAAVKLTVALRQLEGLDKTAIALRVREATNLRQLGSALAYAKEELARKFGCEVSDLRLDHTWALENREKIIRDGEVIGYRPDANDAEWLGYRPHGTQFAGSHDVKTRIRGDNGQLSDNMLAKKERRLLRKLDPKRRKAKIQQRNRQWPTGRKFAKRIKR